MPQKPELLAPAGGPAAFAAALAAGADAVYCGLRRLNARRGAENFTPESLTAWTVRAHAAGARVYLTLNIDVAARELGQAARQLAAAREAHADAVLVRDPALLALHPCFPELEFHFSTQAGVTTSAGVRAAARLGIRRVVLARELTLDEIRAAATAAPGVEVEVFAQGALCFSASGRCLLSSWVGGRSGNRGACASPCRVPYAAAGAPPARHLSMLDLCTVERLAELAAAGVRALKIEGRLKNAAWVEAATRL
ncbi:MAG: peptidase U32 family protein, partial [Lentisphaeria bacterium]